MLSIAKKSTLILTVMTYFLTACGSIDTVNDTDANEAKFYGSYEAYFDATVSKLFFYVTYRIGGSTGTTVRVGDSSQITIDNIPMTVADGDVSAINITGTYYHYEISTSKPNDSYQVVWTKTTGEQVVNTITVPQPFTISTPHDQFTQVKSQDISLTAVGQDNQAGESTYCTIYSELTPQPEQDTSATTPCVPNQPATFTATALQKLPTGAVKIRAHKRKTATPSGHEVGGRIISTYDSNTVQGTLSE